MNEEMRKEFEDKMLIFGFGEYQNDFSIDEETGDYINHDLNAMKDGFLIGWKASREAMRPIKLPVRMKNTEAAECYYYNDAIDECKDAIEQAGYKAE